MEFIYLAFYFKQSFNIKIILYLDENSDGVDGELLSMSISEEYFIRHIILIITL